jgi:putative flippase GtrA
MAAGTMSIPELLRFGAVGITSTVTYFAVTAIAGNAPFLLDPVLANVLGFCVSILVSYLGHHAFTFKIKGTHGVYAPRFLASTAMLFVLATGMMAALRYWLQLDHTLSTAAVAVTYPIASYALNALWAFNPTAR